jgi:hypothetical protein
MTKRKEVVQIKCKCNKVPVCDVPNCIHKALHLYIPELCNSRSICPKLRILVSCCDLDGVVINLISSDPKIEVESIAEMITDQSHS